MKRKALGNKKTQKKAAETATASSGESRRPGQLPPLKVRTDAAGIDIGSREIAVAVPPDSNPEPVRTFATFTADLHAVADWLKQCGAHGGDGVHQRVLDPVDADSNAASPGRNDATPIHLAAGLATAEESENALQALLQNGGNAPVADANGDTPLHLAARKGCAGSVRLLVRKGADPAARNRSGKAALDEAPDLFRNVGSIARDYRGKRFSFIRTGAAHVPPDLSCCPKT